MSFFASSNWFFQVLWWANGKIFLFPGYIDQNGPLKPKISITFFGEFHLWRGDIRDGDVGGLAGPGTQRVGLDRGDVGALRLRVSGIIHGLGHMLGLSPFPSYRCVIQVLDIVLGKWGDIDIDYIVLRWLIRARHKHRVKPKASFHTEVVRTRSLFLH